MVWAIQKMRKYLEGYRFAVVTDHQSLKWLQQLKNPSGRLARWAISLQQYDFDIEYRKGVLNQVADALSRQPLPEILDEETMAIQEGDECSWYRSLKEVVINDTDSHPDYAIKEGQLYRHFWERSDHKEAAETSPIATKNSGGKPYSFYLRTHENRQNNHPDLSKVLLARYVQKHQGVCPEVSGLPAFQGFPKTNCRQDAVA